MKRKRLLEFANWLSNSRHKFYQGDSCYCVAGQAARWLAPAGKCMAAQLDANAGTLAHSFELTVHQAQEIYSGPYHANRKSAVAMLRFLAATGKVNWPRAMRITGQKQF